MNYMRRKRAKVIQASKQDSQPSPELKEWLLKDTEDRKKKNKK